MGRLYCVFATAVFLAGVALAPGLAGAGEIDEIRQRFHENVGKNLAKIKDMAAVEDVSTRLPGGKTLRQRVKLFTKGPMIRYEVQAYLRGGAVLKFLTIFNGEQAWTITPAGKLVEIGQDTHGGARPDPVLKYIGLSLGPDSKIVGKKRFEGKPVVIVDNGAGQTLWLDETAAIPLKMEALSPVGSKAEWIFHNFKRVNQVADIPHEVKFIADGAVFYHHVMLVALNAGLADSLFDPFALADAQPEPTTPISPEPNPGAPVPPTIPPHMGN
ncbi:MAG: hypothetical protein OEZ04_02435 [Nitrospinota bacterium]|nr:hypothetical protein [Nitrospinota bacterium]